MHGRFSERRSGVLGTKAPRSKQSFPSYAVDLFPMNLLLLRSGREGERARQDLAVMATPKRGERAAGVVRIALLLSVPLLLLHLLSGDRRLLMASDSEFLGLINRKGKLLSFHFFP